MITDTYGYPLALDKHKQRLRAHSLVRYHVGMSEYEYGVVTSINPEGHVFVHFFGDKRSKACKPSELEKG